LVHKQYFKTSCHRFWDVNVGRLGCSSRQSATGFFLPRGEDVGFERGSRLVDGIARRDVRYWRKADIGPVSGGYPGLPDILYQRD
jgi:hypothetical protein